MAPSMFANKNGCTSSESDVRTKLLDLSGYGKSALLLWKGTPTRLGHALKGLAAGDDVQHLDSWLEGSSVTKQHLQKVAAKEWTALVKVGALADKLASVKTRAMRKTAVT